MKRSWERRGIRTPTRAMERHSLPISTKAEPNAERHVQRADPKGGQEEQRGETPSMETGRPTENAGR